jgi:hypothetical protein
MALTFARTQRVEPYPFEHGVDGVGMVEHPVMSYTVDVHHTRAIERRAPMGNEGVLHGYDRREPCAVEASARLVEGTKERAARGQFTC